MKPEREAPRTPELEALLDAARRPGVLDPAAEERALLAFRAVRDKGVRPSPVRWRRGRDDWRPAGERHRGRALKALVAGVAAAALGGVAVAAGKGAIPLPFGGGAEPKPVRSAPTEPGVEESVEEDSAGGREGAPAGPEWPSSAPDAPPGRPATARDTVAHCRVYLAAVERRGTPNWRRSRAARRPYGPTASHCWRMRCTTPARIRRTQALRRAGPERSRRSRITIRQPISTAEPGKHRRLSPAEGRSWTWKDDRGRHPPQERPRSSFAGAAERPRTSLSAWGAISVTPRCVSVLLPVVQNVDAAPLKHVAC